MMVLIVERVTPSLRGELTRWLLEVKTGVFIGTVSAMVREKMWEKVCKNARNGACILIWKTNNEQGFKMKTWGDPSRQIHDWEGLQLVSKQ